ncbi:MAG: YihY/virulence factor BrkB family protein [Pyrinomonadaceae bacterium]|nr:YihY/virulence factor BrkB family protein [Pyrinomonadaceae bacterium]
MNPVQNFQWKQFAARLYGKIIDTDVFGRAAQTAFYFSFSIFPLILFLISGLGLLVFSAEGLKAELFAYLGQVLPGTAFELVRKTAEEIVVNSSGGKVTLGLAIALWSASSGVDALRNALNAVYELRERRSWWRTKTESLGVTLLVTLLAAVALTIVFYGWQAIGYLSLRIGIANVSPLVLITIQWISIIAVMLLACEIIYNLLPDRRNKRWLWVTPGGLVAISLWLLLTSLFKLYISYFNSYDKAYGSLGAVIILMFWLYLTAVVAMAGGAINSVLSDMAEEPVDEND